MQKKLHFLLIDDDKITATIYQKLLEKAGFQVNLADSGLNILNKIRDLHPDCILCDLSMPDLDGLELFKKVRKLKNISQPTFIIVTGKLFDFDRRNALKAGVDGYFTKPINPNTFIEEITNIISQTMVVKFWGVRGTLPVPGDKTTRYGGNTSCVTVNFANKHFLIFDAGTGIKELSNYLLKRNKFPLSAKLFISHPHYDHIHGIPFFVPLYMKGNEFEIIGTNHNDISMEKLIAGQMDTIYFPITIKEFAAKINFRNVNEESFDIDELNVKTIFLNHPGRCLGYRIQYKDKSFCYITDNELYLKDSSNYNQFEADRLINFIKDTHVLVIDSTYTEAEYLKKPGWGHSCVERVVEVADQAQVKLLCLYHHDPDQFDNDIDAKLKIAKAILKSKHSKTRCIAPKEGDEIII